MTATGTASKPVRTRKSAAPAEQPEAVAETPKAKPEAKLFQATGRSGQVTARKAPAGTKFAVDVQRDGKAAYVGGVVVKFFASEEAAEAFAAPVNSGEMAKRNDWYETARDAVVVEATEVEA